MRHRASRKQHRRNPRHQQQHSRIDLNRRRIIRHRPRAQEMIDQDVIGRRIKIIRELRQRHQSTNAKNPTDNIAIESK